MIDRRVVIKGSLGLGAALTVAGPGLAGGAAAPGSGTDAPLDLASPADRLTTFVKLRGALDPDLVVSWVSARYYGVVDDRMDPLFSVVSAVFSRWRRAGAGFEAASFELAWFTDSETGTVLQTYANPYTGKPCQVPGGGFAPTLIRFQQDLSLQLGTKVPGLTLEHEVLPFVVRGDDIWMTERTRSTLELPGAARPFRYAESNSFLADRRQATSRDSRRVTSHVSFTNVCSWRPWLEMGDRPGHLMAIGTGRQNVDIAALPDEWREATATLRPEVLRDPAAILKPLWDARA